MKPTSTTVTDDPSVPTEPVLVVFGSWGQERHALPRSGRLVIGRGHDADIVVDEPSVSRRHAVLHLDGPPSIEDLGSANGTRVRGTLITERTPIRFGDPIAIGSAALMMLRARPRDSAAGHSGPILADPRMQSIVRVLERVARGDLGVLLSGETGTGKEVLAELVHARSRRAAGPFVAINCAALPDGLVEAELFGHERGAFTGAVGDRRGLFEEADGGTLFLDEVGELGAPTQAKLLRVLEDRSIRPLGGRAPTKVDVRVVAATHRDLRNDAGFRPDLYFRLAGIVVEVPALRDRRGDVLPLAAHFLSRAAIAAERSTPSLSAAAEAWLLAQPWPGNVRELRNAIDRAVLLCEGHVIEIEHLTGTPMDASPSRDASLRSSMEDVERARIQATLDACDWNQSEAARRLGISRNTLAARIRSYGLVRNS